MSWGKGGAPVVWHAVLLRPECFRAVIWLSVPYRPRSPVPPTSAMPRTADAEFYQLYFQKPDLAEAELARNARACLTCFPLCSHKANEKTNYYAVPFASRRSLRSLA